LRDVTCPRKKKGTTLENLTYEPFGICEFSSVDFNDYGSFPPVSFPLLWNHNLTTRSDFRATGLGVALYFKFLGQLAVMFFVLGNSRFLFSSSPRC
jgi:hypothetical protein